MNKLLAGRIRQLAAVSKFAQQAILEHDSDALMRTMVKLIARTLHVEYAEVLELQPHGNLLFLRAGFGWKKGLVGLATVSADAQSQAGFTLAGMQPVIVSDLRTETRFCGQKLLHDHGIISSVSCPIPSDENRPFGVFGVHSTRPLEFGDQEVHFLQTMASILGNTIRRNQAEKTLKENRMKYESLIDHIPEAVYSILPNQKDPPIYVSPHLTEWTGIDSETFYTNPEIWMNIIHPDDRDGVVEAYGMAVADRAPYILEYRVIHQHIETFRSVKDQGIPIINEKDELIRYDGIMTDITKHKVIEQELQRLTSDLETKVGERTEELQRSHENLRKVAAELTVAEHRERRRLASDLHDYLAQLLVVCRMKLGQATTINTNPDLAELLQSSDQMLEESLTYTRSLIAELSPQVLYQFGLPPALRWLGEQMAKYGLTVEVQDSVGSVDFADDVAILLFQTVRELLMNVTKHAEVSHATVSLIREREDLIKIIVEDRGNGFDLRAAKNLKSFGLFSIRERIEALKGCFDLDSAPGKGTRATIAMPLQAPEKKSVVPPVIPQTLRASPVTPSEIVKVLLVDDMAMVREGLRSVLQNYANIKVIAEAEDGQEAIELARSCRPDVIVMDINMPKSNGIEATKKILKELPHIKVIGLSINDHKEQRDLMMQAGGINYLKKDCAAAELYEAICKAYPKKLGVT